VIGERDLSGRVMKEWLVSSPANTRWLALAREALDFARLG
jgi:hypothetical protein